MSGKLKEVRERMKSVRSTQQITKAMKMVAAAKLRKAQEAILKLRPYADKLDEILQHILENAADGTASTFSKARDVHNALIVVMTSDRGLCGAFNSNVIKEAVRIIDTRYRDVRFDGNLTIMCIGKRGLDYFKKRYQDCTIIDEHVDLFKNLSFKQSALIADQIMEGYAEGEYDAVDVAYGRFKNPATQYPKSITLLPVPLEKPKKKKLIRADYIFEPGENIVLTQIIPSILRMDFHKFLLDTNASQQGARMTAMDKATENAEELLKDLRLGYNKARQEAITKELSEIVGGAAALEG